MTQWKLKAKWKTLVACRALVLPPGHSRGTGLPDHSWVKINHDQCYLLADQCPHFGKGVAQGQHVRVKLNHGLWIMSTTQN